MLYSWSAFCRFIISQSVVLKLILCISGIHLVNRLFLLAFCFFNLLVLLLCTLMLMSVFHLFYFSNQLMCFTYSLIFIAACRVCFVLYSRNTFFIFFILFFFCFTESESFSFYFPSICYYCSSSVYFFRCLFLILIFYL